MNYKDNKELRCQCEKCFGFCCVALYFSASDGFPTNKEAGKPCINLQANFKCAIHENLMNKGLKGCTAYDCFGAGQKVAQVTFKGHDWRQVPEYAKQMFDAFLVMRQLHEMLWYLNQAFALQTDKISKDEISLLIENTEKFTILDAKELLALDIESHRDKVNIVLRNTSEKIRAKTYMEGKLSHKNKKSGAHRLDYFGADLRKTNLRGADLRGACLIAANLSGVDLTGADFIAADLRDANLCGTNLANSIFLTQAQINTAKGDSNTKLPGTIIRPDCWTK